MMILASCAVPIAAMSGRISRIEGVVFLIMGVAYTLTLIRLGRGTQLADESARRRQPATRGETPFQVLLVLIGLLALVFGSRWLVAGAVAVAADLGVSQLVIGLTIVAAGTSMPELATSVVATIRGEREIAVGNVVGSNIFNILFVLGLSAVVSAGGVTVAPEMLRFDIPIMMAAAIACLPIFFTGCRVSRWEGLLFVAYYLAYGIHLVLAARAHSALPAYRVAFLGFVMPLTALGLGLSGWAARRR
jgi:cation:H+ antiporter